MGSPGPITIGPLTSPLPAPKHGAETGRGTSTMERTGMPERAIMARLRRSGGRWALVLLAGLTLAAPAAADEAGIKAFLIDYLTEGGQHDVGPAKVAIAHADLDGDGTDEAIVYLLGQYWCGSGGCNAYVLQAEGDSWAIRMETSVTQTPIGVLDTVTNGWRDIFVTVGGGGSPGGMVAMSFDGTMYPANPTTAGTPGKLKGTVLIGADDMGEPLQ